MNFFIKVLLACCCLISSAYAEGSYQDFIKDKQRQDGYFSFYLDKAEGKVYLEIEQFEQDFLFQSSLPHGVGSNDIGLDRGQLGNTRLVRFERVGKKVFLRQLNTYYRAESNNKFEQQAVDEAFASSIIWGFKVSHQSVDNQKVLIDYTPFLLSDIHGLSEKLTRIKQGNFQVDIARSGIYEKRSKAFPHNTELEATLTFKGNGAGKYLRSVTPDANALTVNLHHSLIKLPDDNYQSRAFHPYSGYWENSYADYASSIDQPLIKRMIARHRLAKKNPHATMSEAVEPIVYYLDAGAPEPIKSALLTGALWWQQAFEAIGYKDAFQVKILPEGVDPMDIRYNVIQWVHRATRGWSYGASVIDPRTGEIIKGHVTLGSLRVRQDYLIALGLTSPFIDENSDTSKMKEMALARIRQLSAHEVGHTLGLAHNFAASSNNRASVMDYPHPLIEIKAGKIDLSNAYAEDIGAWDKFAIAYGYADANGITEHDYLTKLVNEVQQQGLAFISDPDARPKSGAHNTAHLWDNGSNASEELVRVLDVRALALKNFGLNSIAIGTPFSELEQVLVPIYNFHRFQVEAAAKLIAGVNYSYTVRNGNAPVQPQIVSAKQQKAALAALLTTLTPRVLAIPKHVSNLIPPKAYGYYRDRESFASQTGLTFDPITAAQAAAKNTLSLLLNAQRLARLQQQALNDENIPSVAELFERVITVTIKSKPEQSTGLLIQQRVNQEVVDQLITLWHGASTVPEVRSEVYLLLSDLNLWLKQSMKFSTYQTLRAHFALLNQQINYSLKQDDRIKSVSTIALPPGSPIGSY